MLVSKRKEKLRVWSAHGVYLYVLIPVPSVISSPSGAVYIRSQFLPIFLVIYLKTFYCKLLWAFSKIYVKLDGPVI